jgi:hypothetical protein
MTPSQLFDLSVVAAAEAGEAYPRVWLLTLREAALRTAASDAGPFGLAEAIVAAGTALAPTWPGGVRDAIERGISLQISWLASMEQATDPAAGEQRDESRRVVAEAAAARVRRTALTSDPDARAVLDRIAALGGNRGVTFNQLAVMPNLPYAAIKPMLDELVEHQLVRLVADRYRLAAV